jgi:hypothetical protein
VIIKEEKILKVFLENFLEKFFKGRNLNLTINDVKNIFKLFLVNKNNYECLNFFNLFINLLNFVELKGEGSRTIHQVNQDLILLQYSLDFINNKKLVDNIIKNEKNFNEKINEIYDKINDLLINMINESDYKNIEKLNKKQLNEKNSQIKKKKLIFNGIYKVFNKFNKTFNLIENKDFSSKIKDFEEIYKEKINKNYNIIISK